MARSSTHERLQVRIGYHFADPDLLDRALTHSSAVSPAKRTERSYQRLEFLGDRVLGLVVANMLFGQQPKANEGMLSRTLNSLVRKETCARVARDLDLGSELNLGESEARTGGADKEAILADVCEAVIGAIYLDGGLAAAAEFVERKFGTDIEVDRSGRADAKTTLQEWAQAQGLEPPAYVQVARTGPDHAPEFTIAVQLGRYDEVKATGPSKKLAEHKAAEAFLLRENVWKEGR